MSKTKLIHHSASRGRLYPPSSLRGLNHCLEARAQLIEVDITPLTGGGFALLHGPSLDRSTDGSGPVAERTAEEIKGLRYVHQGAVTDEPVGLLAEALELIGDHPHPVELQLDLKLHALPTSAVLSALVEQLELLKDRVRVTCLGDWVVRSLRALDSDLALGFDPLLYLDVPGKEKRPSWVAPFRVGAYDYLDDHPLSGKRWGEPAQYLAARAEALWDQCPGAEVWYIHAPMLARALDDGFDWIAYLHDKGTGVDAWTLDPDDEGKVALANRLIAAGIDRITTNDPVGLAARLEGSIEF